MSPLQIYLALLAMAITCYVIPSIIAQITGRQLICLSWAVTIAAFIYGADQFGLTDAGLWHIEHWNAPAAQIALLHQAETNPTVQDVCAFSGAIDDWEAEVETALLSGGNSERMFLTVKAAPNVILTDAARYDDVDNPVRKGTPAFAQAKELNTGQRVLISGSISPSQTLCRASLRDNGRYTLLFSPSRIEPDRSLLRVRGLWVQGLVWAFLTSPVLLWLYLGRIREPTLTGLRKTTTFSFSAPKELGEGIKGVDVAALLLIYQRHLSKGEDHEAKLTLDTVEGVQPKDDEEWLTLSIIFHKANRLVSERLVSERYLAANPSNAVVQLRLAQLLGQTSRERPKAIELARSLLRRADLTEQQMRDLGELFRSWYDRTTAIQVYRRLLDLYPDSLEGESRLLLLRSGVDSGDDLTGAIRRFRTHIPDVSYWYVTCADLASRVKDITLFEECVSHILGRMHTLDLYWNRQFIDACLRLGRKQEAEDAYLALDYAAISSEAALKRLLELADFYSFTGVTLLACRRLVDVAPTPVLRAKLSQLEFFARGMAEKTPPGGPKG